MTTALARIDATTLARLVSGADRGDDAKQTRELIRSNPVGAITVLADRDNNCLSLWGEANLLEEIVGEVADPEEAATLIREYIADAHLEEMLAVRGDLPSGAAEVVDADRLIGAMLKDIGLGEVDIAGRALVFLTWSLKAMDRPDWGEILMMEIDGLTIQDLILLAIWNDVVPDEEGDDDDVNDDDFDVISSDVFDAHGIDPTDGRARLRELLEEEAGLDEVDVEHARKMLGNLRKVAEEDQTEAKDGHRDLNSLAAAAKASVDAAAEEDE